MNADEIATRAAIFGALGLSPNGLCIGAAQPTLRNVEARMDDATREVLTQQELAVCSELDIAPHKFLVARGPVLPPPKPAIVRAVQPPSRYAKAMAQITDLGTEFDLVDGGNHEHLVTRAFEHLAEYDDTGSRKFLVRAAKCLMRALEK